MLNILRSERGRWVLAVAILAVPVFGQASQDVKPVVVEAKDLTKRPELVGKEVVVDDRVSLFQYHKDRGFDQIFLKRAPEVSFDLPENLVTQHAPQAPVMRIRGVLRQERGRYRVDVSEFNALPNDLARLNGAVALLSRADVETRYAWAQWAERRAKDFDDEPLRKRARELDAEVIRTEGERPPGRDPGRFWIELAERARARKVSEPEPSAQAHQGFRALLTTLKSADEFKSLRDRIEAFFPTAVKPDFTGADLAPWLAAYLKAPSETYRTAGNDLRAALDHRLWADAQQEYLSKRAQRDPKGLINLAEEAKQSLPDRPELERQWLEAGLLDASRNIALLRKADVEKLTRLYRESLHEPEKARDLTKSWLNDQKNHRISPGDSEGRILLAAQYETLLEDSGTAMELLRDAWKINPGSREVNEAFRLRGYRLEDGEWTQVRKKDRDPEKSVVAQGVSEPPANAKPRGLGESLIHASPEDVILRMGGKPNRKVVVASQGKTLEQWIYIQPKQNHYVNLRRKSGELRFHVVSSYSVTRTPGDLSVSP